MKPNPFSALNHFTVPVSSTDVPEDGPLDVADLKFRHGSAAAVALSAVNYRPLRENEKLITPLIRRKWL
jgi:hypothetical protein